MSAMKARQLTRLFGERSRNLMGNVAGKNLMGLPEAKLSSYVHSTESVSGSHFDVIDDLRTVNQVAVPYYIRAVLVIND
jgi:hypothetical protein